MSAKKYISKINKGGVDIYIKDLESIDSINGSLALAMLMPKINNSTYSTVTMTTNPEFYTVITDSADKIVSGVRKDGSYVGLPYIEAVDAIIEVIDDIDNP